MAAEKIGRKDASASWFEIASFAVGKSKGVKSIVSAPAGVTTR
jgi:hypothetical protein